MQDILNKKQFYKLYNQGLLGNKTKTWDSYNSLLKSNHKLPVMIRSSNDKKKFCFPFIPIKDIPMVLKNNKINEDEVIFNEHSPDETNLIWQGELQDCPGGLYLFYGTLKVPMRQGMPYFKSISGLNCKLLLKETLSPNAYDFLMELLNKYPDHIIELSAYDCDVGLIPHQNMIIWEVRKY